MRPARILIALGAGIFAALVFAGIGVEPLFAWAWGALVSAIAWVVGTPMPDDPRHDAPGGDEQSDYRGSEVSRLAWAINLRSDAVGEAVTRRVRATLRRRLALIGIDPDDPAHAHAVEECLGDGLWARLNGRRTGVQDIRDALAAAERLTPEERS